jgi:TRAP transporter 4TM/12TM fusion protein
MFKNLSKIEKLFFDFLAISLLIFYFYAALIEPVATQYHRGVYVLITYVLVFLLYRSTNKYMRIFDYLLLVISAAPVIYYMVYFVDLNHRAGIETPLDQWISLIGVLVGIEVARRVIGNVFVIIGVAMLFYGVFGESIPGLFTHSGGGLLDTISVTIFLTNDGVFGIMANVLATYVLLFVLFGAFLEKSGAQKFFIDLPLALVGHKVGGPAKVAVVTSAIFGSISGSAIANTASTGAFTIPLMKRAGFRPHIAGGVEPAASIGGMFMPPIMGAGGFIMAELTGISYNIIMLIAIFPALLYFGSVFVMVHYEAKIHNIKGEKSDTEAMKIFKEGWFYCIPLIVITILMISGYSPAYAAVAGIISCIMIIWTKGGTYAITQVVIMMILLALNAYMIVELSNFYVVAISCGVALGASIIRKESTIDFTPIIEAAREGAANSLLIGATVGVIGIIISMLTFSGLTFSFTSIVIQLADGQLWLTILFIALASLVLGMGVPVTAAYLIVAVIAVPALVELGVSPIAAHFIVYWLSQDSNITPPVCIAAFVGATIAKANMWKTAFAAFKFAKFLYLGPFLFAYVPVFLMYNYIPETSSYEWYSATSIIVTFTAIAIGTYLYAYLLSFHWYYYLTGKIKKEATNV